MQESDVLPTWGRLAFFFCLWLAGCGGEGGVDPNASDVDSAPALVGVSCDESLRSSFKPDDLTTVVAVQSFKQGEPLTLQGSNSLTPLTANADICLVKLSVGPGHAGPQDAPSTSSGIGIEIWLPAPDAWNGRLRASGGGGFQGGAAGSASEIASPEAAALAGATGVVTSTSDGGHTTVSGSFAMLPDGTINTALWVDFASRALYEQAVKTKALAIAYYGKAPEFSYWDGRSTGGRQGLMLAQKYPEAYDGIMADAPAINWTRFATAALYPQIVIQRDLGGFPLTEAQKVLVSNAAIRACDLVGGQHLGYVVDPASCHYDPTSDTNVLCRSDGGANESEACVSKAQAAAVNKIWYGMTADGSAPDPQADNGWSAVTTDSILGSSIQRWFGLARGTNLAGLAGSTPFRIATDQVALQLQRPEMASATFMNASGNGQDLWKSLSYAQLSHAFDLGVALQPEFGYINTDEPDLSAFRQRGGKLLMWHGLADELVMPQGIINYYHRMAAQMGGLDALQDFSRLFLVPGLGHGTANGTSNQEALIPEFGAGQMYDLLASWVERGVPPGEVILSKVTDSATVTRPVCAYPAKLVYTQGDPIQASSWRCS